MSRLELVEEPVGHQVGEALLEPQVVEPLHGDEVAEPLVADLVVDERRAVGVLEVGGVVVEDQRVLAVEDRARVLHAAVGKAR